MLHLNKISVALMKKILLTLCISVSLTGCSLKKSEEKSEGKYPVIDVVNSLGKYQRAYCSDYFSSIELIPLETNTNSLIGGEPVVLANDSLIFICSYISYNFIPPRLNIHVFNYLGKYLNKIGAIGQGPGEYIGVSDFFLNHEKPTVFVHDPRSILEYECNGQFIGSFPKPNIGELSLMNISYLENDIFMGSVSYSYGNRFKYFLFDRTGNIVKEIPGCCFYDANSQLRNGLLSTINIFRLDRRLYVKDYINDTLYTIVDLNLQPVSFFDFGKYAYPLGKINSEGQKEIMPLNNDGTTNIMKINQIIGTPNHYFYSIYVPPIFPRPKARTTFFLGIKVAGEADVHGIYDIEKDVNILLDTDRHYQKGLINDINGGLSFFPRYYAGNDVVVDIWQVEDMKELLTEDYFASLPIKDPQAHLKLRELLKNLKDDDNPVVVIAKLK